MSDTENPPVDPADPPTNQGGGTNSTQSGETSSDAETTDATRSADPPVQQPGGG